VLSPPVCYLSNVTLQHVTLGYIMLSHTMLFCVNLEP
jgi:hypothetical protein